ELDDELSSYVEQLTAEQMARGRSAAEARRLALLELGGSDQVKEEVRAVRMGARIEQVLRDAKYAARGLARNPGFASAALLALALGMGVTTSIFSLVHGVLLRPLPYPEPHELQRIWLNNPEQGIEKDITSYPNLRAWRERSRSFDQVVAVRSITRNLTGSGDPDELRGEAVTEGFFEMYGVSPALGSLFSVEQASPDGPRAVVLSHGLWSTRFAADRTLIGRTIQLNGEAIPVVGVMPAGFGDAQFWIPQQFTAAQSGLRESWGALWLPVFGRLRDGVTLEQAQAEMSRIARDLSAEQPAVENQGVLLEPLHTSIVGDSRTSLLLLLGAVVLVLLIACANIANLLLARSTNRRAELSVRVALGAGRGALMRQVMVESLLLGLLGGALGTALAWVSTGAMVKFATGSLPRLASVRVDLLVLAFSLGASVLASVLFGLAPALAVARHKVGDLIRGTGRGAVRGASGVRPALVAGQFALALVLLYSAGLLLRSFAHLLNEERGFDPTNVLLLDITLPGQRYATPAARHQFYDQLLTQVNALPGVQSADAVSALLLSRLPNSASISIENKADLSEVDANLPVAYDAITPGLPNTLRMTLLQGRQFNTSDGPNTPAVALVNQTFAKRFLPNEQPLGRRFTFGTPQGDSTQWIQIVGIIRDAARSGVAEPVMPYTFMPHAQQPAGRMQLVVRTAGDPLTAVPRIRELMRGVDPLQPLSNVRSLDHDLSEGLAPRRFVLLLLATFAVAAVTLAAIGIYGVISYMVSRRTREFGLRMALGAEPRSVLLLVMRQAGQPVAIGIVLGTVGAFGAARLLGTQLFGVTGFDLPTQGGVLVLLTLVAALAAWIPARRATSADPLIALRAE
ncbi:MAG: ADOP family duplicated permease, partial [Longimicrobiales bacterium]